MQGSAAIPGAPSDFLHTPVTVLFEEGPPDTPQFCVQLAKRHLTGRAALGRRLGPATQKYCSDYHPEPTPPTQQVLKNGSDFARVTSQADSDRLASAFPDIVFVEKLPTLTELRIFCAPIVAMDRRVMTFAANSSEHSPVGRAPTGGIGGEWK